MNLGFWIYERLGVHVADSDAELLVALDEWADTGLKKGRDGVTRELRDAIRREHHEAFDLYVAVMR